MKNRISILHIFNDPKFSSGYFEFLIRHKVDLKNHSLFHYRCKKTTCNDYGMDTVFAPHFFSIIPNLVLLKSLFQANKIIIHSLAAPYLLFYLFLFPSLAHKSFWAIWGKDLYFYKNLEHPRIYHKVYEFFRKKVIKNIPNIIGFSKRDVELARKWYGTKAKLHFSFSYPSNCYEEYPQSVGCNDEVVILVGNSADPSNEHREAFSIIKKYTDEKIKIISPLSYGDKKYAKYVKDLGYELFGDKFVALEDMLTKKKYFSLLADVDIGLFAHKRQQAMGSIIALLGMKKKVYIRNDITTWGTLSELGLKLYDLNEFDTSMPDEKVMVNNHVKIKDYFSEESLLRQWLNIFDYRLK